MYDMPGVHYAGFRLFRRTFISISTNVQALKETAKDRSDRRH